MVTFAEKLKQLRQDAGLSQEALARAIGMSVSTVHDYEQGRKEPLMRSAFKLARALGVDCRVFDTEDDAQAEPPPPAKKGKRK
jgi:transcriptional regulator with XRE-family HTH domain